MARCLAISRSPRWSPGPLNPARDAAILQEVMDALRAHGHTVDRVDEEAYLPPLSSYDYIFSMARSLKVLMLLVRSGVPCINAPRGVMHTSQSREDTLTLLQQAGLPVPRYWAYDPEADEMFLTEPHLQQLLPAWIKAMHPQGVRPGDVIQVGTPLEADSAVLQFQAGGYSDIIAMQHVEGTLVKVYAIVASHEVLYVSHPAYRPMAQAIADTLELQVFGFDLILDAQDQPWIIDVNDWPSFSTVRETVAPLIAALVPNH